MNAKMTVNARVTTSALLNVREKKRGWGVAAVGLSLVFLAGCNEPAKVAATTSPSVMASAEVNDADLTTNVKTALLRDAAVKSLDIAVVATKGDVRLTGVVDNQGQIDQAVKVARSIDGVHSIHDELTVRK